MPQGQFLIHRAGFNPVESLVWSENPYSLIGLYKQEILTENHELFALYKFLDSSRSTSGIILLMSFAKSRLDISDAAGGWQGFFFGLLPTEDQVSEARLILILFNPLRG